MEVRTFPNWTRPGIGMKPRRENQRPLLPQHARHCPVLEAGSGLGFMVYPALDPDESFHVEFQGEGVYQLIYLQTLAGKWQPVFTLKITMPVGTIGMFTGAPWGGLSVIAVVLAVVAAGGCSSAVEPTPFAS